MIRCMPDVAPEDFPSLEQFRLFIMTLINLVEEQAMIASFTHPLAQFDVELQTKRAAKGTEIGKKSAKPNRSVIVQLVLGCRERGEDPKPYAAAWAAEYGYSRQQIYNIIEKYSVKHLT